MSDGRTLESARRSGTREWAKEMADRAAARVSAQPRFGRRGSREKELFAQRANHVRTLFRSLETMAIGVNKEAGSQLIVVETALNPKNLGGIDVPDNARLVLKFLERRVELVLAPLVNIGGRPAAIGALATASVIQYDPADPAGTDWHDLSLREDGSWVGKSTDGEPPPPPFGEADVRRLFEWLIG